MPEGLPRERKLARTFTDLADTLTATFDVDAFLSMLCARTQQVLAVEAAGVLVETEEGELGLVAASSEASEAIDLFEAQARQGPCYEAYVEGRQVFAEDLAAAGQRWPDFAPRAAAAGFRAVAAFPLQLREEPIGAMNLFRSQPGAFEEADLHAAQALADLATIGLTCRRQLSAEELRSEQLQTALDSRVVIEQAKGVIAERHGVGPGEAFKTLRHHARSSNRRLRQVAREVVDGDLEL